VADERAHHDVYLPCDGVFAAFALTSYADTKVVILGQVGDAAATRVLPHPAHRDAEQLGDVGGGEQSITQDEGDKLA
jgi:hypothetical protein